MSLSKPFYGLLSTGLIRKTRSTWLKNVYWYVDNPIIYNNVGNVDARPTNSSRYIKVTYFTVYATHTTVSKSKRR